MKKLYIQPLMLFILLALTFQSCGKQDGNADFINKAYDITESDPQQGLLFLDSISNPSSMHKDLYMRYIVIHNQARQKCKQDISKDSLIFIAERHFVGDNDPNISALAHLCAARTHLDANRKEKALYSYSKAAERAILAENNLIAGRSKNNIAYIYFNENMMDSTITNAKKGLYYYDKVENHEHLKMSTIALIGRAYEANNSLDSAYSYFDRGWQMANKNCNLAMQAVFNHNIGVVMLEKNKLDTSIKYFHTALLQTSVTQDSLVASMHLSNIYIQKNLMDSARYYSKIIDNRIAEIQDDRTKKDIYGVLSEYMQKTGDHKEANRYLNLQYSYKFKILESDISVDLIKANNQLIISNNEKEINRMLMFVLLLFIILLIVGVVMHRKYKKLQQKRELEISDMNFEKEKKKYSDKIKKYQDSEKRIKETAEVDKAKTEASKRMIMADSFLSTFRLHKELNDEWGNVNKKYVSSTHNPDIESKPQFQEYMDGLLQDLKEKSENQLFDLAKACVQHIFWGDKIIDKLKYDELIILVLSNLKYSDTVIGEVLEIKPHFIITQQIDLKNKLKDLKFTDEIIWGLIYPDYKAKKSRVYQ